MQPNKRVPWLFLAPHLSLFSVFMMGPVVAIFVLSLYDWNLLGNHRFIGFSNFAEMFEDRQFWRALANTLLFSAVIVPTTMALGLGLALVLNKPLPGRHLFRSALYLPTVISSVASGAVLAWVFDDHYGVLNAMLTSAGLPRVPWLSSTHFAMPSIILATLWLRVGLCMVVYLAALQDIPKDLLDAAA